MNNLEYEKAFENRLPVYARISGITAGEVVIKYSCISAITKRWSEKQGRPVLILELLDENSNSITTVHPEDCFLSMEEAEGKDISNIAIGPHSQQETELQDVVACYQRHMGGFATPAVVDGLESYLKQGMTALVIKRIIEYATENNSRSWKYINAVLKGKLLKGVKTLEDYERDEKMWEERKNRTPHPSAKADTFSSRGRQRSKFNNYTDTNKPDYSDFGQRIIEDMLKEAEN